MKRITKYVCLILSAVVTVLLFGTDTKAYAAQNQEMNLYGIYVNSNEKGDSVLLESKGHYLLMDLGMSSHMPAICQELDRLGVTNIDLYLSHLHVDHVGGSRQDWLYGLKYLYDYGIQIDTLYLPDPVVAPESAGYAQKYEALCHFMDQYMGGRNSMVYLQKGTCFRIGDVMANVIGPDLDFVNSIHPSTYNGKVSEGDIGTEYGDRVPNTYYENNCSLITKFTCGDVSYLTTGDMLRDEADSLVKTLGYELHADIYKMAHHGTATGNTSMLLNYVDPIYSFAQNAGNAYIDAQTGEWRFESSCKVTRATSMPYYIASEKKTIIYHVKNGSIELYKGNTIPTAKKLTGWVGVYGADGTNRPKDFYYIDEDGMPLTGIQEIGNRTYFFNEGGRMGYGNYDKFGNYDPWVVYKNAKKRYFMWSETGNLAYMKTGFSKVRGVLYYFNSEGIKLEGDEDFSLRDIGAYTYGVEPDGEIVTDELRNYENQNYYFQSNGRMAQQQFVELDEGTAYFGVYGTQVFDKMVTRGGKTYYLDESGYMAQDCFLEMNGKEYHFDDDGVMACRKFVRRAGKTYYYGKYGTKVTDQFITLAGKEYYLDEQGVLMRNTMFDVGNSTYYVDANGVLATQKKVKYRGHIYYFGKYSTMVRNKKVRIQGAAYYFGPDGQMYTDMKTTIGKKVYQIDSEGKMKIVK